MREDDHQKNKTIPPGWVITQLGRICSVVRGGSPRPMGDPRYFTGTIPFIKIADVTSSPGKFVLDSHTKVNEEGAKRSRLLPKGSLVLTNSGTVCVPKFLGVDACIHDGFVTFLNLPDELNKDFLYHYFNFLRPFVVEKHKQGVTQVNLNTEIVSSFDVLIPPPAEQKRIVDKLDVLLGRVETCRERLERVQRVLKRFRQSVLATAINGALTDEWRAITVNAQKSKRVKIGDVAAVGTGSTPLRSNEGFYASDGIPWITSAATGAPFVTSAVEFVTPEAIKAHRLKVYPAGTLLVAMYGEGKTRGQVSELAISATINQACAAVVVKTSELLSAYLKVVLQANYLEMRALAEGGNQPNLNLNKVKEFTFLMPAVDEQQEIVQRLDGLLRFVENAEDMISDALLSVDRLTPSILSKAFRGELVPHDPKHVPIPGLSTTPEKSLTTAGKKKANDQQKALSSRR